MVEAPTLVFNEDGSMTANPEFGDLVVAYTLNAISCTLTHPRELTPLQIANILAMTSGYFAGRTAEGYDAIPDAQEHLKEVLDAGMAMGMQENEGLTTRD